MKDYSNEGVACTCGCAASALAQMWLTCTSQPATRRRPVAMVLAAPAVCALGCGLLRAQHHPRLHMRVRSAAIQRGAQAGAAGACVSAAPAGVPRGRRAFKGAAKVAAKGTPLPGGALWAHFRKLGGHWSQLCNVAQNAPEVI